MIEGIPDGWELLAFRRAVSGDYYMNTRGLPETWTLNVSSGSVFAIIRKIEKPKRYRPFQNAAEFEPYRDRWIQRSSKHDTPDTIPAGCFRVTAYNDHHYWTHGGHCITYEQAFNDGKCFDDGTPFGIEVTECK